MTGKTHLICTVTAYSVLAYLHKDGIDVPVLGGDPITVLPLIGIPTAAVGALMPDIDIKNSAMSNKIPFFTKIFTHRGLTHTLIFLIALWLGVSSFTGPKGLLGVSVLLGALFGITFSKKKVLRNIVIISIIYFIIAYLFRNAVHSMMFGLCVGWLFHILEDCCNIKGCPLLFPLTNHKFGILGIKSGSKLEYVFLFVWEFLWIGYLGGVLSGRI